MVLNLNHKEKMQEDDIELLNCVHMTVTRLMECVPIVVTTHTESVALLKKGGQRATKVRRGSVARTQKDRGAHEKRYRHGK